MPDLLLELFSEEIPARMQAGAARDLERLMVGALTDRGYLFEGIKAFAGPRRLTLAITGLPAKQKDVREELKGPKLDAPEAALAGFLKKTGLTKDQLKVEKTQKGDVYIAVIERAGRETPHVLAEIIPEVMGKLPWPKSMRWKPGLSVRWVRPLHSILCTFDGELVPFSFAGISSGLHTSGHRFLSQGKIEARRFDDYAQKLKAAHVVLEAEERAAIIFEGVKQAAFVHQLEMIPDEGLLAEVSGLAEWPVVYVGTIQDEFMDVPAEVLQTSMRTHQKYFSLRDPKTGKMASRFAMVANMIAKDGGKEIVAGNERVLRARLSDAKFFWDEDRKHSLESRVEKLKGIVFHAKLGTQYERVERIGNLAEQIATELKIDPGNAAVAARLCKADLITGVVGEFPELQGIMGRYYALNDHLIPEIADAIRDHYRPQGPNDGVPTAQVSIAVGLADKLDQLVQFFAISEKPTGSSDPYALRRASLGVINLIISNNIRIGLTDLIKRDFAYAVSCIEPDIRETLRFIAETEGSEVKDALEFLNSGIWIYFFSLTGMTKSLSRFSGPLSNLLDEDSEADEFYDVWRDLLNLGRTINSVRDYKFIDAQSFAQGTHVNQWLESASSELAGEVLTFFADRLKVALKGKGTRHDLIDAVFSLGHEDDLMRLVARVEALQAFLKTDDGANLLAGYKRAANILKVEEKKDGKTFISEVSETRLFEPAEKALYAALARARAAITPALEKEDFAAAMGQMAALRGPVDAFFEAVKVNADDKQVRENRLNLLASLRATLHQVADFSKIEG